VAHQSLYRKYRPQTFGDVVGQEHIERTLQNAVAEGKVAHAYLFTGPRGTGKTTTARVLAKALNCSHGPTPEPDGTCEDCIEIAEGRHPDVYELDAASRTGVDNVREEIIGRVDFAPTRGRYKVYIIDEVHMLSTAAFNALLKTLEEPPSRVIFIMATTHPHKVPETIQSRCQRFDFRRIGIDDIVGRLRIICDGEGFDVPDAALALIARHAAGGMRDAITTLEQLASFTGGKIGLADVEGLLGEVDAAQLFEIAGLVARRDIAESFRWVARFAEEGTDLAEFVRELTGHVRNLYVIAAVGDGRGIVEASGDELAMLSSQANEFGGPDRLARMLDLLGELAAELRWSSDQRLSLEVALTRMARPEGDMTLEALAERVESLEAGAAVAGSAPLRSGSSAGARAATPPAPPAESSLRGADPATAAHAPAVAAAVGDRAAMASAGGGIGGADARPATQPAATPTPGRPAKVEPVEEPKPTPMVVELHHAGGLDRATVRRAWPAVCAEIKRLKPGRGQLFALAEPDVDTDGETLVIEFPGDASFSVTLAEDPDVRDVLQRALSSALGFVPPVRYQLGKGKVRPPEREADPAPDYSTPVPREDALKPSAASMAPPAPRHSPVEPGESDYDDGPIPEYYETGAGLTEPVREHSPARPVEASGASDGPPSDVRRMLTETLGGQIVAEHAAPPEAIASADGDDDDAAAELAQPDSAEPTLYDDQGLFESDPREDD
jgi:DNA polymerase-3 subunit gamma/tau